MTPTGKSPDLTLATDRPPLGPIEWRPIAALTPYARNARTHSRAQIEQIAESIRRFGFVNPVLTGADGQIVAGHGRVAAARRLGMTEVPTLRLDHLTAEERRAYVLADNRLADRRSGR